MHVYSFFNLISCFTILTHPVASVPSPVVDESTLRPIPPNPCNPPPCGLNAQCQAVGGVAQCACLAGMIGSVPNCRPECVISSDCPSKEACVNRKCVDPCPGTCGANSECRVVNHAPSCSCRDGFTGNAFADCRPVQAVGKIISNISNSRKFEGDYF